MFQESGDLILTIMKVSSMVIMFLMILITGSIPLRMRSFN
jgi:hypothetical protein